MLLFHFILKAYPMVNKRGVLTPLHQIQWRILKFLSKSRSATWSTAYTMFNQSGAPLKELHAGLFQALQAMRLFLRSTSLLDPLKEHYHLLSVASKVCRSSISASTKLAGIFQIAYNLYFHWSTWTCSPTSSLVPCRSEPLI